MNIYFSHTKKLKEKGTVDEYSTPIGKFAFHGVWVNKFMLYNTYTHTHKGLTYKLVDGE